CPVEVADVVATMMAKAPEDRYANCAEVAEALAPFAAPTPAPQGPRTAGASSRGLSSPYLKGQAVPPRPANRNDTPAPGKPRAAPRREALARPAPRDEDRDPEGIPRPRIQTDVRLRPAAGTVPTGEGLGVAVLTMLVGGLMLLVGGVTAF